MKPLVSIITTLYNYEQYIGELALSVFRQSYKNWEWVIVDDASTDNSVGVLREQYMSESVRLIQHATNLGYSEAKNTALRSARGDFFAMIDADDVLTDRSLEIRLRTLQANPDRLWLHGDALNYNIDGGIEETYIRWNRQKRIECIREGMNLSKEYHHRMIHAQTVMVRRAFHEKLGLYDPTLRFSSDNEMWRRAIRFGLIPVYVPQPVSIYRAHDKRMSRSLYKRQRIRKTKQYIEEIVERRFVEGLEATHTPMLR